MGEGDVVEADEDGRSPVGAAAEGGVDEVGHVQHPGAEGGDELVDRGPFVQPGRDHGRPLPQAVAGHDVGRHADAPEGVGEKASDGDDVE